LRRSTLEKDDPATRHPNRSFMRMAIAEARIGFARGQYAIGAIVVHRGIVVSRAHPTLAESRDPSCHAEVNAIRAAVRFQGRVDRSGSWANLLHHAWLYSTLEPCSMCTSLAIWANFRGIVYGNSMIEFLRAYRMTRRGSHYIFLRSAEVVKHGVPVLRVIGGVLRNECGPLLKLQHSAYVRQ
jgi:tRNA(adenine34) deaminase